MSNERTTGGAGGDAGGIQPQGVWPHTDDPLKKHRPLEEILKEFVASNPNILMDHFGRLAEEAAANLPESIREKMQKFAEEVIAPKVRDVLVNYVNNAKALFDIYDLPLTEESVKILNGKAVIMRAFIAIFSLGDNRHVERINEG